MKQFCVILAGLVATLAGAAAAAGVYYEAVSETESGREAVPYARFEVRGWVESDQGKVVFSDSNHPLMDEGSWLLTGDGGKTIYQVNPATETYMVWNTAGLMGNIAELYKSLEGMVEFSVENTAVEKKTEEEGPTILGYQTIHSTYESTYTLVMTIMGSEQRIVSDTRQELWTTEAVDVPMHGIWLRTEPPNTGIDALDEFLKMEMSKVSKGLPLRTLVTTTTTSQGRSSTTKSTTEITALEERDIDDAVFSIPPGYKQVQMLDLDELIRRQQQ